MKFLSSTLLTQMPILGTSMHFWDLEVTRVYDVGYFSRYVMYPFYFHIQNKYRRTQKKYLCLHR